MRRKLIILAVALCGTVLLTQAAYAGEDCAGPKEAAKACEGNNCAMKDAKADGAGHKHKANEKNVQRPAVTVDALAVLLKANAVPVLLDARSGKYDDGRRIPGAKTLTASADPDAVQQLIPDKDTLVVTYCANVTCPASAQLAAHLEKLGYTNVIELPAGIQGWTDAGHPVEKVN